MTTRRRFGPYIAGAVALVLVSACGSDNKASTGATSAPATTGSPGTTGASATTAPAANYPPIPAGPIKLGVSAALSGPSAQGGLLTQKSFEQTIKSFNARHPDGIDGHPVQIELQDDASDVTKAVNVANQFVSDKVAAVVTVTYSPAGTLQQIQILNKNKVPMVTSSGNDELSDTSKYPYWFGSGPSNKQEGQATAQWIAKHPEIKTIGILGDGTPSTTEPIQDLVDALKTAAPSVQVVKQVNVTPGSVDVSTQVAQLKSANPDLLLVNVSFGLGPIWSAIQAAGWNPRIMTSALVWYDSFTGMGPLANNADTIYQNCVADGHPPFPKTLTDEMDIYANTFGANTVNYLTFVSNDSVPLEMMKVAIEKYHSVDGDAIKKALEQMNNQMFFDTFSFTFTPTNHRGINGTLGAAVCKTTPFLDGPYRIPAIAS